MSQVFELPEEMTIYSAVETRDALLAWVTEQAPKVDGALDISAAQVREIDGSGLQLLASLSHIDHAWQLRHPSDALQEACKTLGLADWLDQHIATA